MEMCKSLGLLSRTVSSQIISLPCLSLSPSFYLSTHFSLFHFFSITPHSLAFISALSVHTHIYSHVLHENSAHAYSWKKKKKCRGKENCPTYWKWALLIHTFDQDKSALSGSTIRPETYLQTQMLSQCLANTSMCCTYLTFLFHSSS